jgi:hypothetical protein
MTTIIKKENLKNNIFNEYNSLKGFMNLNSTEEETLISLLNQLAESLFSSKKSSSHLYNMEIYDNHLHKKYLKQQQKKAICDFLLHKGSFI